jgi:ribonuclease Z
MPKDAARVFAKCAPRLAVLNHVVLIGGGDDAPSVQELIDAIRQEYDGAFVVGEDLMKFALE